MKKNREIINYLLGQIEELKFEIKINRYYLKSVENDDSIIKKRKNDISRSIVKIKTIKEVLKFIKD